MWHLVVALLVVTTCATTSCNVKDFGGASFEDSANAIAARGDGKTKDTLAIQKALSTCSQILIPQVATTPVCTSHLPKGKVPHWASQHLFQHPSYHRRNTVGIN